MRGLKVGLTSLWVVDVPVNTRVKELRRNAFAGNEEIAVVPTIPSYDIEDCLRSPEVQCDQKLRTL
jgi:hypothetical protein